MGTELRSEIGSRRPTVRRWLLWVALAGLWIAALPVRAGGPGSGVVVEDVTPGTAAALAGFEAGDLLLRWTFRPGSPAAGRPRAGTLATPFDLDEIFLELVPRGELDFEGWSRGRAAAWTLRSNGSLVFGLAVRPVLDAERWARYQQGCPEAGPSDSPRMAAWYRLCHARAALAAGDTEAAEQAYGAAAEILRRATDPQAEATILREWAGQLVDRKAARALELFAAALALERRRAGAGLSAAYTLGMLAWLADREGDLAAAERAWLERLALLEELAPQGLEVARTLHVLGYLALWRGDTAAAGERLSRSEALQRPTAAGTLFYAGTLNNLALLAQVLGDLARAEALQRQVIVLNARLTPGSPDHGGSLMNLALTLILRGELAAAEDLLRQSVELLDRPEAGSRGTAGPYANLGALSLYRGDLAAAQSYYELALSRLRRSPDSIELADVQAALAEVARKQGRFAEARAWEENALAITERLALGDLGRANRLLARARIEREGGDPAGEEKLLRQAATLLQGLGREDAAANAARRDLGRLLARTGRLEEAETHYRQVLDSLERRGLGGTKEESEVRNLLGHVQRRRGDLAAAEESFCRATRIVDVQRSRLGGGLESRSWFESETQGYAFDCLAALADLGRHGEAFHALERGKSRVFLQLLAERDLRFAGLSPELQAERTRLDAEYDRILSQLSQPGSAEADTVALRARLEDLKAGREALVARLRRQSPGVAALQAPEPAGLAEARRALDPGTVLLAYAVGPEHSYLFVVRPAGDRSSGLEVHCLPTGRSDLEQEIAAFRRLLTDPGSGRVQLDARAARLHDLLLGPAGRRLKRAKRILIAADGPLHLLPWAALRRGNRYLIEGRPLHLTPSATVYAETRRSRRPAGEQGSWRLVAFGDPQYPTGAAGDDLADSEVRAARRRGARLEPLPATREEIRAIAGLFPGAEVYLGAEATEERAKQAAAHADLLHFASHGLIDERFPLDSALALTLPADSEGRDNGLLQAWEVFEGVRLGAHLVTLSACDTALGREMGGEGILGLTRAFQFAGARTVLASLWNVSDDSTARLMKGFYTHLRQGQSKDEALRAAQLDLLRARHGEDAHPYHWAGFSLYGDWR